MLVLNVGGGANRSLPAEYAGWEQRVLDVDPGVKPDVLMDAREMASLPSDTYDAVYCSHNLEHYYRHEVPMVLAGFRHVLKPGGKVEIHVPDVVEAFRSMVERGLDLSDTWYRTPSGPVSYHDVIYGWNRAMAAGNLYYAHKCGFTADMLGDALLQAKFTEVQVQVGGGNLRALATKGA